MKFIQLDLTQGSMTAVKKLMPFMEKNGFWPSEKGQADLLELICRMTNTDTHAHQWGCIIVPPKDTVIGRSVMCAECRWRDDATYNDISCCTDVKDSMEEAEKRGDRSGCMALLIEVPDRRYVGAAFVYLGYLRCQAKSHDKEGSK